MKFSLDTKIINPENDKINNAMVLLHGYGGDADDISAVTLNWKRFLPNTIFYVLTAMKYAQLIQMGFNGLVWKR